MFSSCQNNTPDTKVDQYASYKIYSPTIQIRNNPNYLDTLESILFQRYNRLPTELFKEYGQALSQKYDTLSNRHYESLDTIITVRWPGYTVKLYHVTDDGRYLFNGMFITDSMLLSDFGITKGLLSDSLESILNKSHRQLNSKNELILEYVVNENDPESFMLFKFIDKKLYELEYIPYMD